MPDPAPLSPDDDAWLAAGLAQASAALDSTAPILRHLVLQEEREVFGDAVIAQVRGMIDDVARQLAVALAQAGGAAEGAEPDLADVTGFADLLCANGAFLAAVHGQALEWHLAQRLEQAHSVDMVLAPLIEAAMARQDGAAPALAMAVLVAQRAFARRSGACSGHWASCRKTCCALPWARCMRARATTMPKCRAARSLPSARCACASMRSGGAWRCCAAWSMRCPIRPPRSIRCRPDRPCSSPRWPAPWAPRARMRRC
jgi:hypothetical protein